MTPAQSLSKLQAQHEDIRKKDKKSDYLQKKVPLFLEKEGVDVAEDMSSDLKEILDKCPTLTDVQKMFLKEQISLSAKSDSRAHRWHPSMIRFAFHLKMKTSTLEDMRDSGVIKLPTSRTLFHYSRPPRGYI